MNNYIVKNLKKRFQTSMIGSIARIEDYFGFLWGIDKDKISHIEEQNKNLWEELRTEILNHCNYQMRLALDELEEFLEKQENYYEYKFIINSQHNKEKK
jgi:hypothetical protein